MKEPLLHCLFLCDTLQVVYGKLKQDVSLDSTTSVGELKDLVEKNTQIARAGQKILVKGKPLTDDNQTLEQVGIVQGWCSCACLVAEGNCQSSCQHAGLSRREGLTACDNTELPLAMSAEL
jgi:hypothetical protein